VIFLARGAGLRNPFFAADPPYHTVVIVGYDDTRQQFITHEPGTRRGLDFRYSYATLMAAMADFVPGMPASAPRRAVFTSPALTDTAARDDDGDGLPKALEVALGTSLSAADMPGGGALIKTPTSPTVFFVSNGQKQPIVSEAVFLANGWQWQDVRVVDTETVQQISTGPMIVSKR